MRSNYTIPCLLFLLSSARGHHKKQNSALEETQKPNIVIFLADELAMLISVLSAAKIWSLPV